MKQEKKIGNRCGKEWGRGIVRAEVGLEEKRGRESGREEKKLEERQ